MQAANTDFGHQGRDAKTFPEDRASQADYIGTFVGSERSEMAGGSAYIPPHKRKDNGARKAATPGKQSDSNCPDEPQVAISMSFPSALRKDMEAVLKQLQSDSSHDLQSIWWEGAGCSVTIPRGTPTEQRQWQERLQAAAQQGYDSTPDYDPEPLHGSPNCSAPKVDFGRFEVTLRNARVALLQQFLGDLPSLTAKWGRVPADATWYDKMVADPVACAWLGNNLISDWFLYVAICPDEVTDAVIMEACAIRRERVLAPVLVSTPVSQKLHCQKLAFLTKRANRAAGMQIIVRSPNVIDIYPVKCTREHMMLLPAMGRAPGNHHCTVPQSTLVLPGAFSSPGDASEVPVDDDMPKGLLKTIRNASSTIQVSASSVQGMVAAPAAVSSAEASGPETPRINNTSKGMNYASHQETGTPDNPCAPTDFIPAKTGAKPPKRSFVRKLLVGAAAGAALGVAAHVAASAATISAVAAAAPSCKTQTSFGMLVGIFSKALDLAVLPVSLVSAIAA